MGLPPIGTVILCNFPFADFKNYKKRPALIVAHSSLDTVILCQVTSRHLPDTPAIMIRSKDFSEGSLPFLSYVRPDKLFTIDAVAVQKILGKLHRTVSDDIRKQISQIFM